MLLVVTLGNETWEVQAYDLNTNTPICELIANSLTFDSRLNDAGAISFNMTIQSPKVQRIVAPILEYGGNPFAIYVFRNGIIVWGGIGWTGKYTRSTGVLEVGGKEFLSYFDQRLAAADYSSVTYPSGLDPAQLLYKALTDVQNTATMGPGASIGLSVVYTPSGIPVIVPGYPTTQQTVVSQIIQDVTSQLTPGYGGVDLDVELAVVGGVPSKTVYTRSPRSGRAAGQSGLIFDMSKAVDVVWATDATQSGNVVTVTGSGTGVKKPKATVNAPGIPIGGLGEAPRLDKVVTVSSLSQTQVSAVAPGIASQYGQPLTTPQVTVLTNTDVPFGSWIIGDDARLFMPPGDDFFPSGYSQYWRIVQHQVTVPDQGAATVQLTFNVPPVY